MDAQQPPSGQPSNRLFPQFKYWADHYAHPGVDDQRCVQAFIDCETFEAQATLKNELRCVASGQFATRPLELIVGRNRSIRHGSLDAWAKAMLLWMASYKG